MPKMSVMLGNSPEKNGKSIDAISPDYHDTLHITEMSILLRLLAGIYAHFPVYLAKFPTTEEEKHRKLRRMTLQ